MSQNNSSLNYYQKMVELMKNKKALKTLQPMLDYKPYEENPYEQYKLIQALIEGVNWTAHFNSQQIKESKEYIKVSYFIKKVKLLSQQKNFVDYFALTFLQSSTFQFLRNNFEKFLKCLKLDMNYKIILATSLAFQNQDEELKNISLQSLIKILQNYEKEGKPLDFPQNFILFFVKFYKINKEQFKNYHKQIKYFFQSSQENIKDNKLKSLLTLGEPQYFDKESNHMDNCSNEYISCLHQQIPLSQLLKEMGQQISHNEDQINQVLSQYQNIDIKDIFYTSLMMLKQNYETQMNKQQEAQNDKSIAQVTFAFLNSKKFHIEEAFKKVKDQIDIKDWDIQKFLKVSKSYYNKKINWSDFYRILINTNEYVFEGYENKIFFEQFFEFLDFTKTNTGVQIPNDLLYTRWKRPQNQTAFLFYLLDDCKLDNLNIKNILQADRNLNVSNLPSQLVLKIQELPQLLQNTTLLKILIELSNQNNYFDQTKALIERFIKKNFEEINCGNNLLNEVLEKMVISILNSSTTLADLIECFFKINQKYMSYIFYKICKEDNNFLYLSKILDYSQTIKDFFLPLTQTNYHYFSISLSLLAVKREFLRLENWVEGRLSQGDIQWIEEFMRYIQNKILKPLQNYTTPNKALIEEVLDKSQITLNGLAIIFENFFLNSRITSGIPKRIKEKIKDFYDKIQIYIPGLNQVCTNDTEKRANRILEEIYFGQVKIEDFIQTVLQLKQSQNNRDQEILSCIIINIIDEFRFYDNFPEKELLITGDIFGQFIAKKIIDGKIQIVYLKALSDSLQKEGKMYQFGIRALNHFIMDTSLNINFEFYRLLFANIKLRNKQYILLNQLYQKLKEDNKHTQIPDEFIEQIQQKIKQHEEDIQKKKILKQKTENKTLKQRLNVANRLKYKEESLSQYLKMNYQIVDKTINLDKKIQEKINFWLNSIEDKKKDINEFLKFVDTSQKIKWFSNYLVFERIPFDHQNQIIYKKLILQSNIKELYYEVQKRTLQMMNGLMDFLISRDRLHVNDLNISKNCGKWACQITLTCNRPIILKDFDIKDKIFKALIEEKIQNIMPTVRAFLEQLDKKSFFNIKVPYINSLLDILREIFVLECISLDIKTSIDCMFNRLDINSKHIYPFNYLKKRMRKRKQLPKKKKMFQSKKSLREVIKLDPNSIQQVLNFDLKQLVAMAINSSIDDIIAPVLQRSVSNTLETTRELIIKDFVAEQDEQKIMNAAEAMITNLTWFIALVTCKEPLRVQITQHLIKFITAQSNMKKDEIKQLSEKLSILNLNLACDIVKNIVVENALNEIQKDNILRKEIRYRIQQKEISQRYESEDLYWLENSLPSELNPRQNNDNLYSIEIYNQVRNTQQNMENEYQQSFMWPSQITPQKKKNFEDEKLKQLLNQIENEIQSPNNQEKMKTFHNIYAQINKILSGAKNVENRIFPYAKEVLEKLFFSPLNQITMDVLRYYSDLLIIYSNFSPKLPKIITMWIFNHQQYIFKHHLISVFLRRNLLHLKDFEEGYSNILKQNNIEALNCIVLILKGLVIEDKIFSIYSFPTILEQIIRMGKTNLIDKFNLEVSIFVTSLTDYIENKNKPNQLMLRLTNLEPEYKKLFQDVSEYFKIINKDIHRLVCKSLKSWMKAENEDEQIKVITKFLDNLKEDNEKPLIIFFCYMFEISVNQSIQNLNNDLQGFQTLEYKYIDNLTKLISVLIRNNNEGTYYFEKILTSLIIVLTKKHFYEQKTFNQKSFFKILVNIMHDLSNGKFGSEQNLDKFSVVLVQTLHILQPIKYPAFSFAWLQLISSKFLVQTLLKKQNHEIWNHYTILIVDLMIFYRDIFSINYLNNEEMKMFYKGTLRILLILIHDFPDFLSEQSFTILEEIPQIFKQFRNIILSAYPKNLKMPNPFQTNTQIMNESIEYQNLPTLTQKIEARINSHNLHSILINFIKKTDQIESQNENLNLILDKFYIYGYKNYLELNIPLLESFVVYVPQFLFQNIYNNQNQQNFENYQKQSYALFIRILNKQDYNLRQSIINAILNNLRYPNFITFYFIKLIILIFEQLEDHILFEQILANLLSRLTIEKPHPWGILSLTYKLMYESNFINKQYYKQNEKYVSEMVRVAFKYGKIENQQLNLIQ